MPSFLVRLRFCSVIRWKFPFFLSVFTEAFVGYVLAWHSDFSLTTKFSPLFSFVEPLFSFLFFRSFHPRSHSLWIFIHSTVKDPLAVKIKGNWVSKYHWPYHVTWGRHGGEECMGGTNQLWTFEIRNSMIVKDTFQSRLNIQFQGFIDRAFKSPISLQ